jgi:transposase
MTGTSASEPSSATLVRELLRRAGLSPEAAARELEIDEKTLRAYCVNKVAPRYVVLALMRLADLRETAER